MSTPQSPGVQAALEGVETVAVGQGAQGGYFQYQTLFKVNT